MLESILDPVYIVNTDYQIEYLNHAAKALLQEGEKTEPFPATPGGSPSAPRNITTWANSTMVRISWDRPELLRGFPVDLYMIYRKTDDGRWISLMTVPDSSDPHWNDTYVEKGETYEYKVTAHNERGVSPEAGPVSATTTMGDPPNVPEDLEVLFDDDDTIKISWKYSGGPSADSFKVHRINDDGTNFQEYSTGDTEYTDTSFEWNSTYQYRVLAINEYGEGLPSSYAEVTVPPKDNGGQGPDGNDTTENNDPNKTPWVLIIVIVVILLLAGGAGAFFFIMQNKNVDKNNEEGEESIDEMENRSDGINLDIDKETGGP